MKNAQPKGKRAKTRLKMPRFFMSLNKDVKIAIKVDNIIVENF